MNPVIVIPSYWTDKEETPSITEVGVYDHATLITKPVPELEICLASLEKVRGVIRVIVLLVCPRRAEISARSRVESICRSHPSLDSVIIGSQEEKAIVKAVAHISPMLKGEALSLRGYGAIRNIGLAAAAIFGHDSVVFLDDDELVLSEDFLIDALFGLCNTNRQGLPILVKSGYFLNNQNSPLAPEKKTTWRDKFWSKRAEFNVWISRALSGPRISRSNVICGGCFVVSAQAYTKIAFDPYITRGEDLDYLLNLRMNGIDVWFDSAWSVKHLPPHSPSHASRFLQDSYRWCYEVAKLRRCNATIGLRQVRPSSLMPYPAPWVSKGVYNRIKRTALRRALCGPERLAYFYIWAQGKRRACAWAEQVCGNYLMLQTHWPRIMQILWENDLVANQLLSTGQTHKSSKINRINAG